MLPLGYLYILKGTEQLLYQHNYMPPTRLIKQQIGLLELRESLEMFKGRKASANCNSFIRNIFMLDVD